MKEKVVRLMKEHCQECDTPEQAVEWALNAGLIPTQAIEYLTIYNAFLKLRSEGNSKEESYELTADLLCISDRTVRRVVEHYKKPKDPASFRTGG